MSAPWPLQQASYNGCAFYVEAQTRASGRRTVIKEIPKSDNPAQTEDMGKRIRKFAVTAYIIYSPVLDPDWETSRNDLIAALEADGTGTLMLPTMLSDDVMAVIVDTYSLTEHQEKGGYAEFSINFIEAGQPAAAAVTDPQATANTAADNASSAATQSSDISGTWQDPIENSGNPYAASDLNTLPTQITPAAGDTAPSSSPMIGNPMP